MEPTEARRTLEAERERGLALIVAAESLEALEAARVSVIGKKAAYTAVQKGLGALSPEARRELGGLANAFRDVIEAALAARRDALEGASDAGLLASDALDMTLPGRSMRAGSLHPLTIVERQIVGVFTRMGYRVAEGPEIEDDWHNFEALNIPADHPARTLKDSLYVDVPAQPGLLLRTETSAVQIRTMEADEPPIYVVAPGRTYRREAVDATHLSVFHQVEGLAVAEGISFAHLKGTLGAFAREVFGPTVAIRLTPDYFPFVEPGCQVAVSCFLCGGVGCRTCGSGWIELLGAGMVHPKELENVGYDPERYTGFAFGMGIERVAMVRYGIPDMRMLVEGDVRFLEQFQGVA